MHVCPHEFAPFLVLLSDFELLVWYFRHLLNMAFSNTDVGSVRAVVDFGEAPSA